MKKMNGNPTVEIHSGQRDRIGAGYCTFQPWQFKAFCVTLQSKSKERQLIRVHVLLLHLSFSPQFANLPSPPVSLYLEILLCPKAVFYFLSNSWSVSPHPTVSLLFSSSSSTSSCAPPGWQRWRRWGRGLCGPSGRLRWPVCTGSHQLTRSCTGAGRMGRIFPP